MAQNNHYNRPVLTVREVAHLLNIHVNTVRRWSDLGVLRTYRIGPRSDRRFRLSDILTFLPQEDKEKLERRMAPTAMGTLVLHK